MEEAVFQVEMTSVIQVSRINITIFYSINNLKYCKLTNIFISQVNITKVRDAKIVIQLVKNVAVLMSGIASFVPHHYYYRNQGKQITY